MLKGESRHCPDCATTTTFLPVEDDCWACTTCDAAISVSGLPRAA